MTRAPSGGHRRVVVGAVLMAVTITCLVNAGISVDSTRRLDGPLPNDLMRRYGEFKPLLADVPRAAYITDDGWRFLNARYALVPTVLDPGFVEVGEDVRDITVFNFEALADAAAHDQPLVVLCDFGDRKSLIGFLDALSVETETRELVQRMVSQSEGVALVSVGG